MMLMFVLLLYVTTFIPVTSLSAPRVNVSKLKTDQSKMKSQLTRHNTREQALASKEALLPKFGGKGDKEVREDNGFTFFELMVRRVGTGPWLRYLDLDGDVETETMVTNVINGGVENELWRGKLDDFIRSSLFGIGIGGETVAISKVKSALPQLKKVRSREIQFGYRIALNDESVYSVEFTHAASVIDKAMEKKALRGLPTRIDVIALMQQHHSRDEDIDQNQPLVHDPIKSDSQQDSPAVNSASEPTYESSKAAVEALLHTLVASMTLAEATSCVLFSDGSATIYDGSTTSPTPLPSTAESKAVISFSAASCGVYILPMRNMQPLYDISVCLRVHSVAGMVDSPFDAELIAGLSAVTLVHMMLTEIQPSINENVGTSSNPGLKEITLHTDSKTLTRAVRTGPQGDLAHRASPTRLALWRLLHDHIQHLTSTTTTSSGSQTEEHGLAQGQGLGSVGVSKGCVDFECQWIPGHPERRDSEKSRWSYKDIGIWVADEVAKDSDEQEIALTGCVLTGSPDDRTDERLRASPLSPLSSSSPTTTTTTTKETKKKITAAVAAAREEELELEHLRSSEGAATVSSEDNGLAQGQGPTLGLSAEEGEKTTLREGVKGVNDDGVSVVGQPLAGDVLEVGQIVSLGNEVEEQLRRQRLQYQQYQQKKLQRKQEQQQQQQQEQMSPPSSQLQPQSDLTPHMAPHVKIPVVTIRGDALVCMSSSLMKHPPKNIPSSRTQ